MIRSLTLFALLLLAPHCAQGQTVFARALNAVTAPATSAVMPNNGQASHMLTVYCTTAVADVTSSLQVRIEGSLDGSTWLPISPDITSLTYSSEMSPAGAYAITKTNGTYRSVRVRAVQAPAGCPIMAYYTGGKQPLGAVVLQGTRYVTQAPASSPDKATWGICTGTDCATGTNLTSYWISTRAQTISKCYIAAKTPPTGASLTVDVQKNGTTSIFAAGSFSLPAATSTVVTTSALSSAATLAEGDYLTIDIEGVGSGTKGKDVIVVCVSQ